jgi:hypothetical protein
MGLLRDADVAERILILHPGGNCGVQRKPLNQKMFNQQCADEISPMAKCWTTIAGHLMWRGLPGTLRGFKKA